jgi:hypothetical protein
MGFVNDKQRRYEPYVGGGGAQTSSGVGGAVDSVFGRTGNVIANTGDYTWAQLNKSVSSLADIATRSASDLSSGTLSDARLSTNIPRKDTKSIHTSAIVTTPATLTDAVTIATDANLSNRFRVTLGGNRTLGNPSNLSDGQQLCWEIIQDGTGGRTLSLDTKFILCTGVLLTNLNTAATKRSFITAIYISASDRLYIVGIVAEP